MPVFGKSLFETVLDTIGPDEIEEDEAPVARAPRMTAHFLPDTSFAERPESHIFESLYADFGPLPPEDRPEIVPDTAPDWLERLSEAEIEADLGLTPQMSAVDIKARRRAFARLNHPDTVAENWRDAATLRMTTANRLVEAALRRS